jgi:hypothetical protein
MSVTAKSAAGLTTTVCVDVQDLFSRGISHGAAGRSTTGRTVPRRICSFVVSRSKTSAQNLLFPRELCPRDLCPRSDSNRHWTDFENGRPASAGPRPPGWPTTLHRSDATPPGWKYPGRNRSRGRDRHLPRPRPARRGGHHPRRPKGPLAHRRDLAVGHRDLPSMAMTSGGLPLTTRPTGPYRPKETRPWKGRPPSDTGRPVTPTCNKSTPKRGQRQSATTHDSCGQNRG